MSKTELFQRYERACDFNRPVVDEKIKHFVQLHYRSLGLEPKPLLKATSFRAVGAAGVAWAAWDARAARDAWDASHISIVVIGAEEIKNESVMEQFLPIFEAFENGLWCYWFLEDCFLWLPIPKIIKIGNRLHCETGPAFELPEEKLYFLNGVLVPDGIVTLPLEKIK